MTLKKLPLSCDTVWRKINK